MNKLCGRRGNTEGFQQDALNKLMTGCDNASMVRYVVHRSVETPHRPHLLHRPPVGSIIQDH